MWRPRLGLHQNQTTPSAVLVWEAKLIWELFCQRAISPALDNRFLIWSEFSIWSIICDSSLLVLIIFYYYCISKVVLSQIFLKIRQNIRTQIKRTGSLKNLILSTELWFSESTSLCSKACCPISKVSWILSLVVSRDKLKEHWGRLLKPWLLCLWNRSHGIALWKSCELCKSVCVTQLSP